MANENLIITRVQNPQTGAFEGTPQEKVAHDIGLINSFHRIWEVVQHDSAFQLRLYLSTLKHARSVCSHLSEEIDKLIVVVEARLHELDRVDRDVRSWENILQKTRT
jgi:hypothetical protein